MTHKTIRKGTYCIFIQLKKGQVIQIGKLGKINFHKGYYVYVGSAMNSLDGRIQRHLGNSKKLHWHIDYLLENPQSEIMGVYLSDDGVKHECEIATQIALQGVEIPNFGSSDCKCKSHLIYFASAFEADFSCRSAFEKLGLQLGKFRA
ncbi:MAG: GIY-YIG nuclease family protein [Methanobacteriaceae archaeon]|nr:GIY-YIG nuclease family protein [Methanobacteriaceae archaeon]